MLDSAIIYTLYQIKILQNSLGSIWTPGWALVEKNYVGYLPVKLIFIKFLMSGFYNYNSRNFNREGTVFSLNDFKLTAVGILEKNNPRTLSTFCISLTVDYFSKIARALTEFMEYMFSRCLRAVRIYCTCQLALPEDQTNILR